MKQQIMKRLIQSGVPETQALIIADVMITADDYGVSTHGTSTLDSHIERINRGGYNLSPNFNIIRDTAVFAVIDGDNAIGFVSANFCMNYAVEKAKKSGIFQVFSRNNNTLGPAFYYPLKAAERGMIGIVFTNSPAQMAPFGGKDKMLGTNPFSAVVPVPGKDPIIIDMAMSVVAKSKFKQYKTEGKKLPDGWALDVNGHPTNDPDEGIQGFVRPMAEFKGFGIAMLIDILAGVVSGAGFLNEVGRFYSEDNSGMNVGYVCIAIDPKAILGEEYDSLINKYIDKLRNSTPVDGEKIILPGDRKIGFYKKRNYSR